MITPWYETMYVVMREAMSKLRQEKPKNVISYCKYKTIDYNGIRSMGKKQLRLFVRENKHMGYFDKPTKQWAELEWSTCQKVTYAKSRLKYAF